MKDDSGPPNRELYALLNLSPDASDEEIRKSYRQWAQVYHPDKYQAPHMKDIATENFQRICEAYEILSDETKRQIYDIYGMEGLTSGLELGPRLSKVEELKEELERLKRLEEQEKMTAHFRPSGRILTSLSLPDFLEGDGIMKGMAMTSEVQSQLSKRNTVAFGGNLQVNDNAGGGSATAVFTHQISPVSSVELIGSAGLQVLVGVQISRQLSQHSTATMAIAKSLRDGSINLSNIWTRKLSETSSGNIHLLLGSGSSISVGWQKKDNKSSASGELKIDTVSLGASAHYMYRFSSKSHGRISGRIGSTALEVEIGGGRKISEFSTVRMLYTIGIQGIYWKFELHRGGQKLTIPILLSGHLDTAFAAGAFFIPTSLYFLLKVQEARASAEKAQQLLQIVADRKRNRQTETGGLVITKALYGNSKVLRKEDESRDISNDLASQVIDVTLPLNFLVNDSGQLKLHEGVKKSGIMGFCDPCPGEHKKLVVEYTYADKNFEVAVDDLEELQIPQEVHRI